ncbi:MAG: hypothetical protein AAF564_09085 [Bacteroidota bacterium]
MADGYKNPGEQDFTDLDEWLCEYVDGTIDPVVCEALEEYMQHNEALASHVERLREARHLLCQYGCSYQAPSGLQPRLRRRLATEIVQEAQPFMGLSSTHLMTLATVTSVVAIMLIFGSSRTTGNATLAGNATPAMAIQEAPRQHHGAAAIVPHNRVTPVRTLATNKFYSKFTHKRAFSHAHATATYAIQANSRPHTLHVTPTIADSRMAP